MKFLWILALAAGLSVYWNIKLHNENSREKKELQKARDGELKLEHDLILARDQKQSRIEEEKKTIQSIDDSLRRKAQELELLKQGLRGTNDVDLGGNNPSTLEWDIRQQKELIADLDRQLKDVKAQQYEASNQNKYVQNQDRWSKAQSENSLQAQITYQTQTLQDIENSLAQAKQDHGDTEVIHKLQAQVSQQRAFVNNLKLQKQNLSRQWTVVSAQHNMRQSLSDLKNNELDLENKLQAEKDNLSRLQQTYNSEKSVANAHKGQMSELQKNYQNKKLEIADLQTQKAEHTQHLSALMAE